MERVKGIEPSSSAWKAEVLPLNYTRIKKCIFLTAEIIIAISLKQIKRKFNISRQKVYKKLMLPFSPIQKIDFLSYHGLVFE